MKWRQQGQVLPMGLAIVALMLMGIFVLYSSGQVATDKQKLANAADAAAYSGSLMQARAMNFQAYTNRAMVANQVSMAQAVTLQSWASYGAVTSENIATVLKPIPVLNVVAQGVASGLDSVERILSPIAKALLNVVDVVNRGLSISQEAMFVSTFVATPDIVEAVVSESDPRFSVNTAYSGLGLAKNLDQWQSFSTRFTNEDVDAMQLRAGMINQSRDAFTEQRNWKFFKNFWFYSSPITRHRLYREGTTELILVDKQGEAQFEWKAKDTLSLHNRLWRWRGTKRYEIPIGWAEAFANSQSSNTTIEPGACSSAQQFAQSSQCARFLDMNGRAEYLADIGTRSPISRQQTQVAMRGFNGLQAFRSLSEATLRQELPRVSLKIEVSMPVDAIKSADSSKLGDTFQAPVAALGDVVTSISTAEIYYQRPDSDNNNPSEKASAYNPYWGARLSAVALSDRMLATGFRSSAGSVSAPTGLGNAAAGLSPYQSEATNANTFDTIVASQHNSSITRYESAIQDELNTALAASINQLLGRSESSNSLLGDEIPSQDEFQRYAETTLAGLNSAEAAQPYQTAINEAERLAEELENEFIRIREQVSDEFEIAYAQTREDVDQEVFVLRDQITDIRQSVGEHSTLNEEALRDQQSQIAVLENKIRELESGVNSRLAVALIEIVNNATSMYVMPFQEALTTVEEWIRNEGDEVNLPWTEVIDED